MVMSMAIYKEPRCGSDGDGFEIGMVMNMSVVIALLPCCRNGYVKKMTMIL